MLDLSKDIQFFVTKKFNFQVVTIICLNYPFIIIDGDFTIK